MDRREENAQANYEIAEDRDLRDSKIITMKIIGKIVEIFLNRPRSIFKQTRINAMNNLINTNRY